MKILTSLFGLSLVLALGTAETAGPQGPPTSDLITRADLEAHVRFLASDELAGRKTGTPENVEAAHYLASQLERLGLQPAGDDGSFLQAVPFQRERFTALPELELLGEAGRVATYGSDFIVRQGGAGGELRLLFVRKAEDLPEEADAGVALCFIDVRRSRARTWLKKAGHAHGMGFGLVLSPARREFGPTSEPPAPGRLHLKKDDSPEAVAWIEYGAELGLAFSSGEVSSLVCDLHYELQALPSYNVIGRLVGVGSEARPELAEQCVVISAHYDHIGVRKPREGDEPGVDLIYNGADDDASGVATVLELAGALAAGPAPARELLFLLATAEEIGIVGTKYYLDHPSTALERTVCNLNFEMVGRPDESAGGAGKLWFTGGELTNLLPAFNAAGLAILADPHPEQHFFERSDNIVFVHRGIVGQTFSTYNLHKDYHAVSDEADALDYVHMEACARAGLAAVQLIASGEVDPAWLPGKQPKLRR